MVITFVMAAESHLYHLAKRGAPYQFRRAVLVELRPLFSDRAELMVRHGLKDRAKDNFLSLLTLSGRTSRQVLIQAG